MAGGQEKMRSVAVAIVGHHQCDRHAIPCNPASGPDQKTSVGGSLSPPPSKTRPRPDKAPPNGQPRTPRPARRARMTPSTASPAWRSAPVTKSTDCLLDTSKREPSACSNSAAVWAVSINSQYISCFAPLVTPIRPLFSASHAIR
jgi:hypothetical protein